MGQYFSRTKPKPGFTQHIAPEVLAFQQRDAQEKSEMAKVVEPWTAELIEQIRTSPFVPAEVIYLILSYLDGMVLVVTPEMLLKRMQQANLKIAQEKDLPLVPRPKPAERRALLLPEYMSKMPNKQGFVQPMLYSFDFSELVLPAYSTDMSLSRKWYNLTQVLTDNGMVYVGDTDLLQYELSHMLKIAESLRFRGCRLRPRTLIQMIDPTHQHDLNGDLLNPGLRKKFSSLVNLDLSENPYLCMMNDQQERKLLVDSLSQKELPSLRSLHLFVSASDMHFGHYQSTPVYDHFPVLEVLEQLPLLTELHLHKAKNYDFTRIAHYLHSASRLRKLFFHRCHFTDQSEAQQFYTNPFLTELHFVDCGNQALWNEEQNYSAGSQLQLVEVVCTSHPIQGSVVSIPRASSSLISVNLTTLLVSFAKFEVALFSDVYPSLTELRLTNACLNNDYILQIAKHPRLRRLDVSSNYLRMAGLATMLREMSRSIESLDIRDNTFEPQQNLVENEENDSVFSNLLFNSKSLTDLTFNASAKDGRQRVFSDAVFDSLLAQEQPTLKYLTLGGLGWSKEKLLEVQAYCKQHSIMLHNNCLVKYK